MSFIKFDSNYEHIISLENLLEAWNEFVLGKKNRKDVQEFQRNLMSNIISLHLAFMKNSLSNAREAISDAEYYICMQGGMEDSSDEMHETAYVMVLDSSGRSEVSGCSTFRVPTQVASEVRNGKDFAKAVDEFFKVQDTKTTGGFVSILTKEIVNKSSHYEQPLVIALSALIQKEWFL